MAVASDLSVSHEAGQLHFGPLQAPIAGGVANVNDTPSRALLDDVDLFQGHQLVIIFFEHFSSPFFVVPLLYHRIIQLSRSFLWVASVRSHFKPIFRFHHPSMATHACVFRTIYIAGGRSLVGGSVPTFQFTVLCNPCGLLAIVTSRCVRQVAFLLC